MTTNQPQADMQTAFRALQTGDAETARRMLIDLSESLPNETSIWMGLATASLKLSDTQTALKAVDRALELQPRQFAVFLMKADVLQAMGEDRRAASFYQAAVSLAPPDHQQSPRMKAELNRARQAYEQATRTYEAALRDRLSGEGYLTQSGQSRYDEAIDILFAKRQVYIQQPHYFYFPGLPQIQFYDRSRFDWVPELEAHTEQIAAEASALMRDEGAFQPYLHDQGTARTSDIDLMDSPDWSACYLIEKGRTVEQNAARCPVTMDALRSVPLCDVEGKMPSVLFSLLRPHTRIEPHNGLFNTRLICHLPLIVPDGCWFRVGNDTRRWNKGELVIFDDSIEHEAANDSDEPRVVLLFDIWRPEQDDRDRQFLRSLFAAMDDGR